MFFGGNDPYFYYWNIDFEGVWKREDRKNRKEEGYKEFCELF